MADDHTCLHEADLAVMAEKMDQAAGDINKVLTILESDQGLVTKVALLRQSVNRAWWWLGGISMGILGGAIFIIRSNL